MKKRLEYALIRFLVAIVQILPLSWGQRIGAGIGNVLYRWIGIRREVVKQNLHRCFSSENRGEIDRIAKECYTFYGRAAVDWVRAGDMLDSVECRVKGWDNLEPFLETGAVITTGHLGYWEQAAIILAQRLGSMTVYADEQSNPYSQQMIDRFRSRFDVHTVSGTRGIRYLAKQVKEGHIVGAVGDQRPRNKPAYVQFFDARVKNTRIPAFLVRQAEVPLIPLVMVETDSGTVELKIDEPLPESRNQQSGEFSSSRLLRQYNAWLEQRIREHPEQYFWLHKRSKPLRQSGD
ncbi:MAG: lysophospholipid acyltransferase family protein [bacterium]